MLGIFEGSLTFDTVIPDRLVELWVQGRMVNMGENIESTEIKGILLAWRDNCEWLRHRTETVITEALTSWALGQCELDEETVYDGIDFMASHFYRSHGNPGSIYPFLKRAAASKLSTRVECASRGYLLTLYGELAEVSRISDLILKEDPTASTHCVAALKKALYLEIPGVAEALQPLLSDPNLDEVDRTELRRLVFARQLKY